MYRWLLFLGLTVCAKVPIDTRGVDTPRGWTVDKSSEDVTATKAFDEGKTLKVDSFDSEEGITTEAIMSASDSIENIKANVEKFNKLVAINVAMRNALKERQDKTCFITKRLKQLEIHVHTRLSPLRVYTPPDDEKWPKITVDLGDEGEKFPDAKVIDSGTVIFSREFLPDKKIKKKKEQYGYTIKHFQKIEVKLADRQEWVFVEFEEKFGRKQCRDRGFFNLSCKGKFYQGKKYYEEANKVIIDKVEVFVKLVDDDNDNLYKIFSDDQQKITLGSAIRRYNFDGFRQNPYWVLHAYSSKCDGWQDNHDGSKFAQEVWKLIENGQTITNDLFEANFSCVEQKLFPNLLTPTNPSPDITKPEAKMVWLDNNKPFSPSSDEEDCQPLTAESIAEKASNSAVHPRCQFPLSDLGNLDDLSEEELNELRNEIQRVVNAGEESNSGMKEEFDDLSKSGCFYDQELTDGITVEIEGQYLLDVAGQYMTNTKFIAKGKKLAETHGGDFTPPNIIDDGGVTLYINLGLDERSYPLIPQFFSDDDDGSYTSEIVIEPDYTKNFKVSDIAFVHLSRGGAYRNKKAKINRQYEKSSWHGFATPQIDTAMTIDVELGIVNIQKIALYLGEKLFYEREAGDKSANPETEVKGGLFTLNSVVNSWTDYNIKENSAWQEKRRDGCSD